jgi:hypothetical protein
MIRSFIAHISVIVGMFAQPALSAPTACPIVPMKLTLDGGKAGPTAVILSDGSISGDQQSGDTAMVWDEPMQLRHQDGSTCAVSENVLIIAAPIFNAGGKVLYVPTYSGSNSHLFAVSISNCEVLWESPVYTVGPKLRGEEFLFSDAPKAVIGPDCLPLKR